MDQMVTNPPDARPPPVVDIDLYSDAALADILPVYAALREAGPAVVLQRYGVYAMGRHRDVMAVLRDWRTFSSTGGSGIADIRKPDSWRVPSVIVEVDPPDHTRVRQALNKIVLPSVIKQWREDFERVADRLVDEMLARGSFDGVKDLAETFVSTVLPDALGLPDSPERRENLFLLGEWNFDGQGPRNARFEETNRRAVQIDPWYQQMMRRESLVPGGFGEKIFESADAGDILPHEAPGLLRSFLRGGLDSTTSAISAALCHLAANPDQYAMLRADPSLIRNAIEEAMRIESSIPNVGRLTMRDAVIDGVLVPADSKLMVILGAANHDPSVFESPERFDVTRRTQGHVALGYGIHMCVGQAIARLEADVLLRALVAKVARLELAGEPVRKLNNNLRSLGSIPLRAAAA